MIVPYENSNLIDFNKETLGGLEPYFNISFINEDKTQWFHNLLTVAQHNLGMAHCIQHNATSRYIMELSFDNFPDFYQQDFHKIIGSYSSHKKQDTVTLDRGILKGEKHWISNLHQADFAIIRIPFEKHETFVLCDLSKINPGKIFVNDQIGLELARPGGLIFDGEYVDPNHILGNRGFHDNDSKFTKAINFHDYCFITNYLGCIISLHTVISDHCLTKKFNVDYELKKFQLEIANLKMGWYDNLHSVDTHDVNDTFWHRRNTQYTNGKKLLISLIGFALEVADSTWMMKQGSHNQVFRDALVFSAHMQSCYGAISTKQFFS